jgi:hypothetical protein
MAFLEAALRTHRQSRGSLAAQASCLAYRGFPIRPSCEPHAPCRLSILRSATATEDGEAGNTAGGKLALPRFLTVRSCTFLLALVLTFLSIFRVEAETSREYRIKAAFLFNFAQFAEWPPEAFLEKDSPLVIGVLSAIDPFGGVLDETVKNEAVQGRRLVVKHITRLAEMQTCHILYIGQSESKRLERIVDELKGKPVLTVSDITDCASRGLMIGFISERNKIRFKINASTARAANLSLSSKLLRAAEIVGPE